MAVSDEAHAWMEAKLAKWQQENGKEDHEHPAKREWYWDARVECIQAGHTSISMNCSDVVYSWLSSRCRLKKKAKAAAAWEEKKAKAKDVD